MGKNTFIGKLSSGISHRIKALFNNRYQKVGLSWIDVKKLKHLSSGKERKINFFNGVIHYVSPQELFHGIDEIFISDIYGQSLRKDAYIIDCGANIGMSVIYLKAHAPNAVIEAFEPDEKNFYLLAKNIKSYNLNNVRLHKAAVWKENTILNFASDGSMSSKIDDRSESESSTKVQAVRLKEFLVKPIDFLKIDIEGAEYAVLLDIAESLSFVSAMFVEYHGTYNQNNELLQIFQIINKAGFSFYIKEATPVYDSPFLKKRRHPGDWDVQLNIFCLRN